MLDTLRSSYDKNNGAWMIEFSRYLDTGDEKD